MSFVSRRLLAWYYLAVVGERDHISTILFRAFSHRGASASSHTPLQTTHLSDQTPARMLTCAHTLRNSRTAILDAKVHTNESSSILLGGKLSHGPSARIN